MSKDDFFERFRVLHEMDGKAPLSISERTDYERVKERFAAAICAAQRLVVKPGHTARATFRVPCIFKLKLTLDGAVQQTSTLDLSVGGFGARLARAPATTGGEVAFELFLTKAESISGQARVEEIRNNNDATFSFVDLRRSSCERLERMLFDMMLQQLVRAAVKG